MYPTLRVRGLRTSGWKTRRGRKIGSGLRKRNELGLAWICLIPGPPGVSHQGLDGDTDEHKPWQEASTY